MGEGRVAEEGGEGEHKRVMKWRTLMGQLTASSSWCTGTSQAEQDFTNCSKLECCLFGVVSLWWLLTHIHAHHPTATTILGFFTVPSSSRPAWAPYSCLAVSLPWQFHFWHGAELWRDLSCHFLTLRLFWLLRFALHLMVGNSCYLFRALSRLYIWHKMSQEEYET